MERAILLRPATVDLGRPSGLLRLSSQHSLQYISPPRLFFKVISNLIPSPLPPPPIQIHFPKVYPFLPPSFLSLSLSHTHNPHSPPQKQQKRKQQSRPPHTPHIYQISKPHISPHVSLHILSHFISPHISSHFTSPHKSSLLEINAAATPQRAGTASTLHCTTLDLIVLCKRILLGESTSRGGCAGYIYIGMLGGRDDVGLWF